MRNNKYISMLALISMSMGTVSWGQGPGHGGPGQAGPGGGWGGPHNQHFGGQNGLGRINTPVYNTGCGQQYSNPNQTPILQACVAGGAAGMQTAQRYAAQQGRADGFKSGYAWGLRSGIDATRNDPNQIAAGQMSLNANDSPVAIQKLAVADQAGSSAGAVAGGQNGDQEAIARFHNAIDTGSMPSNVVSQSDYTRYNPTYNSRYDNPASETLGAQQTEQSILNSGQIDAGQVTFYSNGYDAQVFGQSGPGQFRPGDFYAQNGNYGYNRNAVLDGRSVFNNVYSGQRGFNTAGYSQLGVVQILTGYTTAPAGSVAPAAPAPSAPVAASGGQQGGGQGGVHGGPGQGGGQGRPGGQPAAPSAPAAPAPVAAAPAAPAETPFVPQPIYQTVDLRAVYQTAFINSYQAMAPAAYNNAFNDIVDDGTNAGYYVGQQVGQRLAFQQGFVNAFNSTFRQRENNAFLFGASGMPGYQAAFQTQFNTEYANYANNPVIGVDSFSIAGVRDDGIVEPGEGIRASFVVRNYGGQEARLPISLEGDITGQAAPAILRVPRLSTVTQSGTLSASISNSVPSQSDADVTLNVNGSKIPLSQYVTRQVVSKPATYTADYAHGTISVSMPLQNVSRVNSYDAVKVITTDSMGRTQTIPLGMLTGGQTWNIPFNLNGFDQLAMINGNVSVKVQVLLGSLEIASATVTADALSNADKYLQTASAFEVIAQSGDSGKLASITKVISDQILFEMINTPRTRYNNVDSQLKGLVTAKSQNTQNATTLAAYKTLGDSLLPIERDSRVPKEWPFGGRSVNTKWFESQISLIQSH